MEIHFDLPREDIWHSLISAFFHQHRWRVLLLPLIYAFGVLFLLILSKQSLFLAALWSLLSLLIISVIWTLDLAARVSVEVGIASRLVSGETVCNALGQLGVRWKRAKHWITSPDPDYLRKKHRRDSLIRFVLAHPNWALGFLDEVWWTGDRTGPSRKSNG